MLTPPIHVLALESRRRSAALAVHKTLPLPAGSLRAIAVPSCDEPLFVTSPELTLVHVALTTSFARTVHLGYEFCGTFAPDENRSFGLRSREPLTSPDKIAAYLRKVGDVRGRTPSERRFPTF